MAELRHRALPYVEQCLLLRTCARLLRLPARAIVAALLFLHRFYRACPAEEQHQHSPQLLVAACICLASKVEEVSVSNNHLLNTVNVVAHLCMQQPSQSERVCKAVIAIATHGLLGGNIRLRGLPTTFTLFPSHALPRSHLSHAAAAASSGSLNSPALGRAAVCRHARRLG